VRIAVPAFEDVRAMTNVIPERRELAHRVSGGIEVALYWRADDNTTSIEVWQAETGETVLFAVASELALDAFYHPFAHLPTTTADLIPDR
jgi:hypothetical protein